jgi:FMN phosphatase YigB (HAD superfamily)
MRPLSALPPEDARRLRGVLFDLDDTLLSHGVLELAAYEALWRLYDAGLALVAVTGRPVGWADVLVRQWPSTWCAAAEASCDTTLATAPNAAHDASGSRGWSSA